MDWLQTLLDDISSASPFRGALEALSHQGGYMLFRRQEQRFQLLERRGYADPRFAYPFLRQRPELLAATIREGYGQLPDREASQGGFSLYAVTDRPRLPSHLLLAELPAVWEAPEALLRMMLVSELALRRQLPAPVSSAVDLPVWLADLLTGMLEKPSPLLILAETGSGKEELVQSFLKQRYGSSDAALFFHPGRLSQAVQLRELFGDPAGARLGGSSPAVPIVRRQEPLVVIQEAGDLDPLAQLRILALFSSAKDDKFWIFESSQDLQVMQQNERFLSGLYNFLQPGLIRLPPVRARMERIEEEVDRLLLSFQQHYRRQVTLAPQAMAVIKGYHWPGNWRELKNTLESAFLMAAGSRLEAGDLRLGHWAVPEDWDDLNLRRRTEDAEKSLLLRAYAMHSGNQVQMARALGISRGSLQYKLDKHRLN